MGNSSPQHQREGSMPDGQQGNLILKLLAESLDYIWLIILALWGGTASYIKRIRETKQAFSLVELIGEWSISGFCGVITMMMCTEFGYSFYMTAALTGIAGHLGGRGVHLFERFFASKFGINGK